MREEIYLPKDLFDPHDQFSGNTINGYAFAIARTHSHKNPSIKISFSTTPHKSGQDNK